MSIWSSVVDRYAGSDETPLGIIRSQLELEALTGRTGQILEQVVGGVPVTPTSFAHVLDGILHRHELQLLSEERLRGQNTRTDTKIYGNIERRLFMQMHGADPWEKDKAEGGVFFTINGPVLRVCAIVRELQPQLTEPTPTRKIFTLHSSGDNLQLLHCGTIRDDSLAIRENYVPLVMEQFDHMTKCLTGDDPCGRLSILAGPPGTGKTHLVSGLMASIGDAAFVLVQPPELLSALAGPKALGTLINARSQTGSDRLVLIVEDADAIVAKRMNENMHAIQALLNFSDGILGSQVLDVRIIVTTNSLELKFDEALLRPGRCCRNVTVDRLPYEQAVAVLKRLAPGVALPVLRSEAKDESFSLAEIYATARAAR